MAPITNTRNRARILFVDRVALIVKDTAESYSDEMHASNSQSLKTAQVAGAMLLDGRGGLMVLKC